jgi:hypothetical protein
MNILKPPAWPGRHIDSRRRSTGLICSTRISASCRSFGRPCWNHAFDFPVPGLTTYRDAADYIMKLPAKQKQQPHWQFAGKALINAAERGGGWTMLAHMAMLRAMDHGKPAPEKEPRRKAARKNRIIGS